MCNACSPMNMPSNVPDRVMHKDWEWTCAFRQSFCNILSKMDRHRRSGLCSLSVLRSLFAYWTQPPLSIENDTTKLCNHFSSPQGMPVHTQKTVTKLCHTSQIKHETFRKRPTLPAHCLPEWGLDSGGREWNNNKGRILLAYLLWCEICLWEHQKILCTTDNSQSISAH